jgi:hypothetical protein
LASTGHGGGDRGLQIAGGEGQLLAVDLEQEVVEDGQGVAAGQHALKELQLLEQRVLDTMNFIGPC